jgi:hypothetical protein
MYLLKIVCGVVAGASGVVGVVMWWIGSTREKKNMESFVHWKLVPFEPGKSHHQVDTYPYLERIGWWNKWAAVATGVSVLASTATNFLP